MTINNNKKQYSPDRRHYAIIKNTLLFGIQILVYKNTGLGFGTLVQRVKPDLNAKEYLKLIYNIDFQV